MSDSDSQITLTAVDFHGNEFDVPIEKLFWRPSAYAIIIRDNKVLLTHQAESYNLPGGGMEFGESPEECAVREVFEETGLKVESPKLIACKSNIFKAMRADDVEEFLQSILLFYACDFAGGELSLSGIDEHEKTWTFQLPEWIPIEKLDEIKRGSSYEWRDVVRTANKLNQ